MRMQIFLRTLFVVVCAATLTFAQNNARGSTSPVLLTVGGEVSNPVKLTADDLAKLPRRSVQAKDHDGKDTAFEGIELSEVLKLAGVKFGEHLRSKELALFLVIDAADGYRAVFALPELDHAFTDRIILLADRRDGKPLAEKEGPLRIVIPDEKRQARWVRQATSLTIQRAR
ncbi:MAG TPA: molybdopterin-dependent oxidoreductase [Pyrinomonadaceae bacterium]|nr:molybdopterin-dependent oxidoreductase [Pyrinomonadaceae bacterium]